MTRAVNDSALAPTSSSYDVPSAEQTWGPPLAATPLVDSVLLGGFECASQKLADGTRLDLLSETRHDELVAEDYVRLRNVGITVCREGAPWAHVERGGRFDFARFTPMVHAARRHGIDVIWDLLSFGWPDDVSPFDATFPTRFARYAAKFARWISMETDRRLLIVPIDEMSMLARAGGDLRILNPFASARGVELKAQLVRATIEAIEAVRLVVPSTRFIQSEPTIHIVGSNDHDAETRARVELENLLQFQAWDMLTGRVWPALGGHPRYLDVVGVSFSAESQRLLNGTVVGPTDVGYRPFSEILVEGWQRYERPMLVSATGSRGNDRAPWLRYVIGQAVSALRQGCELHGITLLPIIDRERDAARGLWSHEDDVGQRAADDALLHEVLRSGPRLEAARAAMLQARATHRRLV
jgi:hypothetical protein